MGCFEDSSDGAGRLAPIEGDKGQRSAFSCMVTTIFSRVCEVRCRDLESELEQSSWPKDRDLELMVHESLSLKWLLSSEEYELEREGTPLDLGGSESTGVTQSDSRDQTRQLMFSSR